jgi:arylsulfatase A-like enzyme
MSLPNVVCLAIDRLHVGYLGAYGNTWIQTPTFDRLAAESFVLDRATIESPDLAMQYRSLWLGLHALCPENRLAGRATLVERLNAAGYYSVLLTDEPTLAEDVLASQFEERVVIGSDAASSAMEVAQAVEETDAAKFFAAACDWLGSTRQPFFLWLHTGTLGRIWDAPMEFREQYTDEDDPPAKVWADVPNRTLPESFDPDELLAITHAYAGQVTLVDQLLGSFLEALDETELAEGTLLVLLSPRGFPLGEHRRVGPCDEAIYGELVHVPWIWRFSETNKHTGRSQALAQPADLYATILEQCGIGSARQLTAGEGKSILPLAIGQPAAAFDRACIFGPAGQRGIVVPAWSLRLSERGDAGGHQIARTELFAKPDDWFEVNEVSDRCPEIGQQLEATFSAFSDACRSGMPAEPVTLPDELTVGIE